MKISILQSNYIPWKGYFDIIAAVDVFVIYDDMQYTKRDWRNRNLIKTPQELKWLSIPVEVKGKYFQKINETKVLELGWQKSHLGMIKQNYAKSIYFKEIFPWVEELYNSCQFDYITDINLHFIRGINMFLGINTRIRLSSEFNLHEEKTQRLVNICKDLGATSYYSGPAAKAYLDTEKFAKEGIEVHYLDYTGYQEYNQLFPPFEHGVSILDLLFNEGANAHKFLKYL
jgi:hypothetical protein